MNVSLDKAQKIKFLGPIPENFRFFVTIVLPTVLLFLFSPYSEARNMVCGIPIEKNSTGRIDSKYIKIRESKTVIKFLSNNEVSSLQSPGCDKFYTIFYWTDSIKIECESSNGIATNLFLNLVEQSFKKTYINTNKEVNTLTGICYFSKD